MKQIVKEMGLVAVSVVTILGLAVAPVGAEQGSGGGGAADDSTTTTTNTETTSGSHHTTHVEPLDDSTGSSGSGSGGGDNSGTGNLRDQARELLQQKRQDIHEHTEAQKQKACEQRQNSIDKRTTNFGAAAQRHLDVFNNIFTKIKAFHDSKGLNVSNYDALVAAATAKQTAAQSAVDALKALNVQIDCTQSDPATTVATIKSAVSDARTALQAYRKSLVDLVTAIKGASSAHDTSSDTTGGTQ
ncbi:MAG TPA: hypothetical protein VLE99_03950 [Candidatus Saccharimonadales bacterium]|nr:hypothetical protein [Candidatus Saccharimonadales bacterium]